MTNSANPFFEAFGQAPTSRASAPGRIEIIGNHLDYNGGTVVGACIARRLHVAFRIRTDSIIRLFSTLTDTIVETSVQSYGHDRLDAWTQYPLGVYDEFRMLGLIESGFDLMVSSDIPAGEGLSSSAALEMATAVSIDTEVGSALNQDILVGICHRAENRFVGVPCGQMDQSVVGLGQANSLLVLDTATGRHHDVAVNAGIKLLVFRSHIRHDLLHSPYEKRHSECRRALIGLQRVIPGIRHLAHLHPMDISAYDIVLDETLARRARHVVEEQRRVGRFLRALSEHDLRAAGQQLSASHESSRTLFENSAPELDFIVRKLNESGEVLGSRLSGAGWGGAVLAFATQAFSDEDAASIASTYQEMFEAQLLWWRSGFEGGARIEI